MDSRKTMSRLNAALNNIDSAYAIIAKNYGLTFNALMMIYRINESEDITQKQLCDALYLPKSTVHSIVLDFVRQGYLSLETGRNKKEKHVVITAKGRTYFKEIIEETNRMESEVLNALGKAACDFLLQTAETIGSLLNKVIIETYGVEV